MVNISIIVPIYNSTKYLEQTLNSIVNQEFTNFEIICINDASEDESWEIISRYQKMDKRIQAIAHEERMGAARTRNHGLAYAKGEYVVFWDADEIYVSDLLQKMYDAAIKYDADLVLVERGIIKGTLDCIMPESSNLYKSDGYDSSTFKLQELPQSGLVMWPSSPVNRMVKRQFIVENGIEYQDLQSSNDVLFADMTMILANRIIHIEDWKPKVYVRRNIKGSISMNRNPFCSYMAFEEVKRQLISRGIWGKYKKYVMYQFASTAYSELNRCNDMKIHKEYYEYLKSEGINKFFEEDKEYAIFNIPLGIYIKDILEMPYEKRCWERTLFSRRLEENGQKLLSMIHFFQSSYAKVALWGIGKWGKEVIAFLKENYDFDFDYYIDNNADLIGIQFEGKPINAFKEVKNQIDIVVLTSERYKADILAQIRSENVKLKVFVLPKYLGETLIQSIEEA